MSPDVISVSRAYVEQGYGTEGAFEFSTALEYFPVRDSFIVRYLLGWEEHTDPARALRAYAQACIGGAETLEWEMTRGHGTGPTSPPHGADPRARLKHLRRIIGDYRLEAAQAAGDAERIQAGEPYTE